MSAARPLAAATDAMVIARSLRRPDAFAAIFDRHWEAIRAFCAARGGSAGEDIAAETFRIAFDRRRAFDPRYASARPWLYGIATNLLREHFRSAERGARSNARSAAQAPSGDADHADDALGRVEAAQLGPRLAAALGAVAAGDRDALLLLAWAELGYEEIAAALEIPVGTVRSRLHRARRTLRHTLASTREDLP